MLPFPETTYTGGFYRHEVDPSPQIREPCGRMALY